MLGIATPFTREWQCSITSNGRTCGRGPIRSRYGWM